MPEDLREKLFDGLFARLANAGLGITEDSRRNEGRQLDGVKRMHEIQTLLRGEVGPRGEETERLQRLVEGVSDPATRMTIIIADMKGDRTNEGD